MLSKPAFPDDGKSLGDRVHGVVARTTGQSPIHDDYSLAGDLFLDDLARGELLMAVELAFHIEFSEAEAAVIETVGDLVGLVRWKTFTGAPDDDTAGVVSELAPPLRSAHRAKGSSGG